MAMVFNSMVFKGVLAFPSLLTLILLPYNIIAVKLSADEKCIANLDIVHVQDMTESFDSSWPIMEREVRSIMESIVKTDLNPRFGFASFGDETREHHGYREDFCFNVDAPLRKPDFKVAAKIFFEKFGRKRAARTKKDSSGGVFEALARTLSSPKLSWRKNYEKLARIVVVVTDELAQLRGDLFSLTLKRDMMAGGRKRHGPRGYHDCNSVAYNKIKQAVDLIKELDVYVMILVTPNGTFENGEFLPAAEFPGQGTKYRNFNDLQLWYKDHLSKAGLDNVFVAQLDPKMQDYAKAFKTGLDSFNYVRCEQPSTTSTTTTTTAPIAWYDDWM